MKLALLGLDSDTVELARAAVGLRHEIAWGWGDESQYAAVREIAPRLVCSSQWEDVLLHDTADAVIVPMLPGIAADAQDGDANEEAAELRAEQLRRLVQENVPLLLAHPTHPSMLLHYELDMVRRESGCPVVPFLATRFDPAVLRLVELIRRGELGKVEQAVFTRETSVRGRSAVLARFAGDVDLLRQVCGDLKRLSAMGPAHGARDYSSLGVQLSAADGTPARWTLAPAAAGERAKLTVLGTNGTADLVISSSIDLQVRAKNAESESPLAQSGDEGASSYESAIESLAAAVARQPVSPDLLDAARAMELTDSIDRSLRRGRVVDLHYEEFSEQSTFKGHMTALGCGILMLSLLLLVIAAIAGRFKVAWLQFGSMALILVMGVLFLAMQFFRLAAPGNSK